MTAPLQTSEDALEQVKKKADETEAKLNQLTSTLDDLQETNRKLNSQVKEMQENHNTHSGVQGRFDEAQAEASTINLQTA